MSISGIGGGNLQHLMARPTAPRISAGKDMDGDHDGTAPGKVDVRDVLASGKVAAAPVKIAAPEGSSPPVQVDAAEVLPQPGKVDVKV
jgi:hypothetical protein